MRGLRLVSWRFSGPAASSENLAVKDWHSGGEGVDLAVERALAGSCRHTVVDFARRWLGLHDDARNQLLDEVGRSLVPWIPRVKDALQELVHEGVVLEDLHSQSRNDLKDINPSASPLENFVGEKWIAGKDWEKSLVSWQTHIAKE